MSNYTYTETTGNIKSQPGKLKGIFCSAGGGTLTIYDSQTTTTNKTVLIRAGNPAGGSGSYPGTGAFVGLWRSTSAINYVSLIGNSNSFKTGSTFTLYGIKAE
jgi:hypothetical protein